MTAFCETPISVLGFFDNDEGAWSAVALEFDLWGYGDTKEESLEELKDAIEMQVSFSEFKENPDLLLHPALPMYFRMFAQAAESSLRANASHQEAEENTFTGGFPFPRFQDNNNNFAIG